MKVKTSLLVTLLIIILPSLCFAQQNTDSTIITGKVRTHINEPIENVKINLHYKKKLLASCVSDSNGNYRLSVAYMPKTLTVRLKHKGYYRIKMEVIPLPPSFTFPMNFDMLSTAFSTCYIACPRPFDLPGHSIYEGRDYRRLAH